MILIFLILVVPLYYLLRFIWELPTVGNLHSKAVFITGCDSGFGKALALKCAKKGMTVFAACFSQKGENELTKDYRGSNLKTLSLDVRDDQSVEAARTFVGNNLPENIKLWGVVNNAGVFSCYGPDDWLKITDYQSSFDVNTLGVIRVTQAFKKLIKLSKGRIITVTSVNGRISSPAAGPYVVAKYGAEAYMDALRQELYNWEVKCSILEPGIFRTPLLDEEAMTSRVNNVWQSIDNETKEEYGEKFKNYFIKKWNETYISMSSSNIDFVVNNYYHALVAKYPRHRYYCGWDAILIFIPLSLLPSWLTDSAIRIIAKQEIQPACQEKKTKTN
ncbi:unnamed protein product [Auanema sp. JU1783]|nr:unnamed protein product [Auanema sp. JU1783]